MGSRRTVLVEGAIGAGKTELAKAAAAALRARGRRVALALEPVDEWRESGALQKFYGDPAAEAYKFQTYVYATRFKAMRAALAAEPDAELLVLERSPASDQIFMALQPHDPVDRRMYREWCNLFDGHFGLEAGATTVLYLRPSLDQCMARLRARAREGEVEGVTADYQERLLRGHDALFLGVPDADFAGAFTYDFAAARVVTVPPEIADRDFRAGAPGAEELLAEIFALAGL